MDCKRSPSECEIIDLDSEPETEPLNQLKVEPGLCHNELSEIKILDIKSESEAVSSTSIDITTLILEHSRLKSENTELKKSNSRYVKELSILQKERCTVKQINSLLHEKRKIIVDLEEKVGSLNVELNRAKWKLQVAEETLKLTEKKKKDVKDQACQTEFEVVDKSVFIELQKEAQYKEMVLKDLTRRLESTSKEFDSLRAEYKENEAKQKNLKSLLQKAKELENELRHQIFQLSEEKLKMERAAEKAFAEIHEFISEKQKELLIDKDESSTEKIEERSTQIDNETSLDETTPQEALKMDIEAASSVMENRNEIKKLLKPKIYSCDECGKEFSNRNAVYNHKRQHSEFNYKCRLCSKVYARKDNCIKHVQDSHKITRHIANFMGSIKKIE